jgi:hypothetical protein
VASTANTRGQKEWTRGISKSTALHRDACPHADGTHWIDTSAHKTHCTRTHVCTDAEAQLCSHTLNGTYTPPLSHLCLGQPFAHLTSPHSPHSPPLPPLPSPDSSPGRSLASLLQTASAPGPWPFSPWLLSQQQWVLVGGIPNLRESPGDDQSSPSTPLLTPTLPTGCKALL